MVAEATRPRKPAVPPVPYVPAVSVIDYEAGAYSVQSQSDPTEYYIATVGRDSQGVSCTCKAGQTGFASCRHVSYCKHVRAAQIVDGAMADLIGQQMAREAAAIGRQPALAQPAPDLVAQYGGAAGLMELYQQ